MNDATKRKRRVRATSPAPVDLERESSQRGPPGTRAATSSTTASASASCDGRSGGRDQAPSQKLGTGAERREGRGGHRDRGEARVYHSDRPLDRRACPGSEVVRRLGMRAKLALGAVQEDGDVPGGDAQRGRDVLARLLLEHAQRDHRVLDGAELLHARAQAHVLLGRAIAVVRGRRRPAPRPRRGSSGVEARRGGRART